MSEPVGNFAGKGGAAQKAAQVAADEAVHAGHRGESPARDAGENIEHINREFEEKAVRKRAEDLGLAYVDIVKMPLNSDFLNVLEMDEARKARIIPFSKVGEEIKVAFDDPERQETKVMLADLAGRGYKIEKFLASKPGMDESFEMYDHSKRYEKVELVDEVEDLGTVEEEIADLKELPEKLAAVSALEALNLLNVAAMKTKSSDVHYEPRDEVVDVRFRIDGMLHKVFEINKKIYLSVLEQVKFQSKMRMNVLSAPQDGRYVFTLNETKIAVRSATIPTPHGEALVCRYLPSDRKTQTFQELGFSQNARKALEDACKISQGMVLITGPTGSGKSTTLYSMLNKMNTPSNKAITLEDPVEFYMEGVTQSQMDNKNGYNFANGLRSVLRHDPDIVMLGEIRDFETAETALQAALTGHVLLSTLHTNSAVDTVPRLINMGLKPFMVAPALHTVIGQRLVRKVCGECSVNEKLSDSEREEFEEVAMRIREELPGVNFIVPDVIKRAHGCGACSETGYLGRLVIAEVLVLEKEIEELILKRASGPELLAAARRAGMVTILEDGLMKVAAGLTTLDEVRRVMSL